MRGSNLCVLVLLVAVAANAQSINKTTPALVGWVDISTTGTPITGLLDDSEHNFVTTVGNSMFPAGNVRVGTNGAAVAGLTTGEIGYSNAAVAATGIPAGLPAGGAGYLLPFWDDFHGGMGSGTMWWDEVTVPGVLIIQWNQMPHYNYASGASDATFQIQVFNNPPGGFPFVQYLYQDVVFGGAHAVNDNGGSATIGYVSGPSNVQFSFNSPGAVIDGDVVSVFPPFTLAFSSPLGPGSIQIDLVGGTPGGGFFWVVTFAAGNYPNGWFLGLDITLPEIMGLYGVFPFSGVLDGTGSFSLGPIGGLPSFSLYGVGMGFATPVLDVPLQVSKPTSITL